MKRRRLLFSFVLICCLVIPSFSGFSFSREGMTAHAYDYFENNFYFDVENGEAVITGYTGTRSNLVIPSQLGGYPVTIIGEEAFYYRVAGNPIKKVTLPDTVRVVEDLAFHSAGLEEIVFSENLEAIGEASFSRNELTHVHLPDSLSTIGSWSFHMNKLEEVVLPSEVTIIYAAAFSNNKIDSIVLPEKLTAIGEEAFAYNNLSELTFPDSLEEVWGRAFINNPLSSLIIHNADMTIKNHVFYHDFIFDYMEGDHDPGSINIFGHDPSTAKDLSSSYDTYTFYDIKLLDEIKDYRVSVSGGTRYSTAEAIASENYEQADTVIIVRGDGPGNAPNVVDALSASGLAGAHEAPILLTHPTRLLDDTKDAIRNLGAIEAIIVGGDGAVSPHVEDEISKLVETTRRVRVEGGDRFSTASEVAKEVLSINSVDTAIIAGGNALVDSLVAGPVAHEMGYPILLVGRSVPEATEKLIIESGIKNLIIVGGTGVVSQSVEDQLNQLVEGEVKRVSGANRFDTSIAIANEFFSEAENVVLVNGVSFVDAVPASILGDPILYIRERSIPESIETVLNSKQGYRAVGGPGALSDLVLVDALLALAKR